MGLYPIENQVPRGHRPLHIQFELVMSASVTPELAWYRHSTPPPTFHLKPELQDRKDANDIT